MDPQVMLLWMIGLALILILLFLGSALTPFFTAAILAYILEGMVERLSGRYMPRWAAVTVVFVIFVSIVVGLFIWLIPLVIKQLTALIAALPSIARTLQELAAELQTKYASRLDPSYVQELIPRIIREVEAVGRQVVTQTLTYLPSLVGVFVYLLLVPFMVLFFLKDKERIVTWIYSFLPQRRELFSQIMSDVDKRMSSFFRGKIWEMIIISIVSVGAFLFFDFRFAVLMGLISGVSVIIPYLGVLLATIPIVLVALFQFGFSAGALKIIIAYAVIQLIDGNILAPMLLGNMVRIHPAGIIFAVLACGHLWGIGGVIMAFPIAIVVKSLMDLALPYIRRRADEASTRVGEKGQEGEKP
jgi:putative permease